jgi:ABC-type xylose transport system permease subunit
MVQPSHLSLEACISARYLVFECNIVVCHIQRQKRIQSHLNKDVLLEEYICTYVIAAILFWRVLWLVQYSWVNCLLGVLSMVALVVIICQFEDRWE